jgi:glycosyltransferase involved in cell wall biosynthesis
MVEENWPSMQLVADMLVQHLELGHAADFSTTRLAPPMQRCFGNLPVLGRRPLFHNADRLLNRFVNYPRYLRHHAAEFDLFHIVDHSYAQLVHELPPARTVVTCHDLDTFRCLLEPEREIRPGWFRAMTRRILDGFRQAAQVIAVSGATRDELLRHGLVPPERISVVHNGVHPSCSALPDPNADAEAVRLLPGDADNTVWLLNVGSTLPRKRLDLLLRVFATVRREIPEARLVRAGGGFTRTQLQLAEELGVERSIVILPFLDRDVLAAVYRRAALLLHTAEAEGFGLPLIEAMACGCPVVASDVPVLREVGAAAATYCGPEDMDAWKRNVIGLVQEKAQDRIAWDLRRRRALAHAARFSWAENARQTASVYRKILEND